MQGESTSTARTALRNLGNRDTSSHVVEPSVNHKMYRTLVEQVGKLTRELSDERETNLMLRQELTNAQGDRDAFKRQLDYAKESQPSGHISSPCANFVATPLTPQKRIQELSLELSTLQSRYDELLAVHKRAEARYKTDFSKWRDFKKWLFDDEDRGEKGMDTFKNAVSREEKKKRANARVWKKRQMFLKMGPDVTMLENGSLADDGNKENLLPFTPLDERNHGSRAPVRETKKRRLNDYMAGSLPSSPLHSPVILVPSSPSLLFSTSPSPAVISPSICLDPSPVTATTSSCCSTSSSTLFSLTKPSGAISVPLTIPTPVPDGPLPLPPAALNQLSSDRSSSPHKKEDNQQLAQGPTSQPLKRRHSEGFVVAHERMPCSSDTEDDSQAPDPVTSPPVSFKLLPTPTPIPWSAQQAIQNTNDFGGMNLSTQSEPPNPQQPNVVRCFSPSEDDGLKVADSTPCAKDAGKIRTVTAALPTPMCSTKKHLSDYSAYKGRGRYAQHAAEKTINALYTIDPIRNQGRDFQYEEVVRRREDRRRMEAGDCECCRHYYDAIGPLPSRLKQPLWRSPTSTPEKACQQRHLPSSPTDACPPLSAGADHDETALEQRREITSHKQAISRHRHRWTRARTPPGYWNIGFPTTQETIEINQKAQEMHRAKREGVEAEAEKTDGKYRRRS